LRGTALLIDKASKPLRGRRESEEYLPVNDTVEEEAQMKELDKNKDEMERMNNAVWCDWV